MTTAPLATRHRVRLRPDASRVIAQLFVPGHYLPSDDEGQASAVVEHILALDEEAAAAELRTLLQRFDARHRHLEERFRQHADRIDDRLPAGTVLSDTRRSLLGATFTHEYAVEAAALCNPSAVMALDQSGTPSGSLAFIMSVRQIGEGHRSSIGFRTGTIDATGGVVVHPTASVTTAATVSDRDLQNVVETIRGLRQLAGRTYSADFDPTSELSERVLYPATPVEANGMEDARFVRFVDDDDGAVTYYATYTAYDGASIVQQLLATRDFVSFTSSPLLGAAAANKGLALFPRRIDGRYAALSRHDGANNAVTYSDDLHQWPTATPIDCPIEPWEAVQVGNCGPPIETDDGWLVLTHGVGPMRTYSIGAWLLDRADPSKLLGRLRQPLLTPQADETDGYVPNVVYSCGALLHGRTLMIPYGIGDAAIGIATVDLDALLGAMEPAPA